MKNRWNVRDMHKRLIDDKIWKVKELRVLAVYCTIIVFMIITLNNVFFSGGGICTPRHDICISK